MKKGIILFSVISAISFSINAQILKSNKFHKHDGFYISMGMGPCFVDIDNKVKHYPKETYSGQGLNYDLKIGRAVNDNVILHGTLLLTSLAEPEIESNKITYKSSSVKIYELMMGAGFTYYKLPSNLYVSLSAGFGSFMVVDSDSHSNQHYYSDYYHYSEPDSDPDKKTVTELGFSFQWKVGREWWISKDLALGVGVSYGSSYVRNTPDDYIDEKLNSGSFSFLINATFN